MRTMLGRRGGDAGARNGVVGFGVVHGFCAVEPELDVVALGANDVFVPIVWFDDFLDGFRVGSGEDFVPARFVV